jgi:hypothetical protein
LANQADWIAVKELISTSMIEKNRKQVSNLGTAAFCQSQPSKPGLDLDRSDCGQLISPPMRIDPPIEVSCISFLGGIRTPRIFSGEFTLLKMIAKLDDRHGVRTHSMASRIDL